MATALTYSTIYNDASQWEEPSPVHADLLAEVGGGRRRLAHRGQEHHPQHRGPLSDRDRHDP